MRSPSTIFDLLQAGDDESIAISGLDCPDLTYRALRELVAGTTSKLNGLGIGRNDRGAIVLPNGPRMATAFKRTPWNPSRCAAAIPSRTRANPLRPNR